MEYALRALHRIGRHSPAFDATQRGAFRHETRIAIRDYLYTCARDGWRPYADGLRLVGSLYGAPRMLGGFNPKHLARSLWRAA